MNGSPSGKFGQYEVNKLMAVLIFITSSGILTNFTSLLSGIDFGKYTTLVMAGWNLLLAFIYLLAKNNSNPPAPVK